eukprot:3811340-Pyramimonas_sp.AAC.1
MQVCRVQSNALAPCCNDSHHSQRCNQEDIEWHAASLAKRATRAPARVCPYQVRKVSFLVSDLFVPHFTTTTANPENTKNVPKHQMGQACHEHLDPPTDFDED